MNRLVFDTAGLTADDRHLVATTCARRAELELRGAAAFTVITQALFDLRADQEIIAMSARAVVEELRHSNIYLEMARAYATPEAPPCNPTVAPIEPPTHPGTNGELRRILHVVGMCAINETMACSFLELCLHHAQSGGVRAALREILGDEIHHARIGWAFLASSRIDDRQRRQIARWLVPMIEMQWTVWMSHVRALPSGAVPAHACPSGRDIAAAGRAALREVVVPGFAHVGIDVAAASEWLTKLEGPEAEPKIRSSDQSAEVGGELVQIR